MRALLVLCFTLALFHPSGALAGKRVALVIGNFTYKHTTSLRSPGNDATDVAGALKRLGFDVLGGKALLNLDRVEMGRAIRRFTKALRDAEIGLFYYSGHGIQVSGRNYVVPTDGQLEDESDVEFGMFALESIIKTMERGPKTNLVFLDACRDNPLGKGLTKSLGISKGFVPESAGTGTLIAFATEPGNIALDGKGKYSPFTEGLLEHIEKPGIDVAPMLRLVRRDVRRLTNGKQTPWSNSSLEYDFYFAGQRRRIRLKPGDAFKPPLSEAAREWEVVKGTKSKVVLEAFRSKHSDPVYQALAEERLKELAQQVAAALREERKAKEKAKPPQLDAAPQAKPRPSKELDKVAVGISPDKAKPAPKRKSFEPEMVSIPGGSFEMGCVSGENCEPNEKPVHRVTIKAFELGKYEMTFLQWDICVARGGCDGYEPEDRNWGRGKRPVINVSWDDAQAYVKWLRKETGKGYRLPTEAEWEYAARAGTRTAYSWGNLIGKDTANCDLCGSLMDADKTVLVGSFKPNRFGLYDMHGNVWEWTEDCSPNNYLSNYLNAPKDGLAWLGSDGRDCPHYHVYRGGSWTARSRYLRSAYRTAFPSDGRSDSGGFRMARTLTPDALPSPHSIYPFQAILTAQSELRKEPRRLGQSLLRLDIGNVLTIISEVKDEFWYRARDKSGLEGFVLKDKVKTLN